MNERTKEDLLLIVKKQRSLSNVNWELIFKSEVSESIKEDKDFILNFLKLLAVKCDSCIVPCVGQLSKDLLDDEEFIKTVYELNNGIFEFASERIKNNKEFIVELINKEPSFAWRPGIIFRYVSDELKSDRDLAFIAVKRDGANIEYASEGLRNDKELVLESLKGGGINFKFASLQCRSDRDIILTALHESRGSFAIPYIPAEILKEIDKEIIIDTLLFRPQPNQYIYKECPEFIRSDKEIITRLLSDKNLEAKWINVELLQYASDELRSDLEVIELAAKIKIRALNYAVISEDQKKILLEKYS